MIAHDLGPYWETGPLGQPHDKDLIPIPRWLVLTALANLGLVPEPLSQPAIARTMGTLRRYLYEPESLRPEAALREDQP